MAIAHIYKDGLHVRGTSFMEIPAGTTAQRGNPATLAAGSALRVNNQTGLLEWWIQATDTWKSAGSDFTYTESVLSPASGNIPINPNVIYVIEGATGSPELELDVADWSHGQVSYIQTTSTFDYQNGVPRFVDAIGSNVLFNGTAIAGITESGGTAPMKFIKLPRMLYRIEKGVGHNFMVTYMDVSNNVEGSNVRLENVLTTGNNNAKFGRINSYNSASFAPGQSIELPNIDTIPNGASLSFRDIGGDGATSDTKIVSSHGDIVDGVPGGPVYFLHNNEQFFIRNRNGRWVTDREYSDLPVRPTQLTTNPTTGAYYNNTPGVYKTLSLRMDNVFGHAWMQPGNNTVNKGQATVNVSSGNCKAPGREFVNDFSITALQEIFTHEHNGGHFLRHIASTAYDTRYRAQKPMYASYNGVADVGILEMMAGPSNTFILKDANDVTLKLVESNLLHAWVYGDEINIINRTGNNITIDSQGSGAAAIPLVDEEGNVDTAPVVGVKGMLKLMYTEEGFLVMYRAYYT